MGELLKTFNGRGNNQHSRDAPTMRSAAKAAGVSKDQQVTAVRVSNVPAGTFEEAVESENPPTLSLRETLAEGRGVRGSGVGAE